jgi:Asp-tRNA(Asn)/Glu-tRNA(Gln) amidotransferase A subunit family amidase
MSTSLESVVEAARALAARKVSPVELVDATLRRIEQLNPRVNAFITIREAALDEARVAEGEIARGRKAPLLGVPISIKDLMLTRGDRTTAGSRIFGAGLESDHDAPAVARLRQAGAIIVGKNNLHEVALGVTNLNEHFGPARNPWDLTRVPGGSSGGSAIAVATGLGLASIGSDTRGSIRIPAACCGVTGFKPTFGLVSTDDVIPLAWSLDHVGPLTRSVEDAAHVVGCLAGPDALQRYVAALRRPVREIRIGIGDYFMADLDPEIERAVSDAAQVFAAECGPVRSIALPELEGYHLAVAGGHLSRQDTAREPWGIWAGRARPAGSGIPVVGNRPGARRAASGAGGRGVRPGVRAGGLSDRGDVARVSVSDRGRPPRHSGPGDRCAGRVSAVDVSGEPRGTPGAQRSVRVRAEWSSDEPSVDGGAGTGGCAVHSRILLPDSDRLACPGPGGLMRQEAEV